MEKCTVSFGACQDREAERTKRKQNKKKQCGTRNLSFSLTKRTKCCILYAAKAFVLYRKECFFMRKILSLLLILALFLPCALAETPQGIDLALTSTDAAGRI